MPKMGNTARTLSAALLDFCGFALLLAALNFALAGDDPLWISGNPNPWLLLPVYLGCRYGFVSGCVSGLITAAVAGVVVAGQSDGLTVQEALLGQRFLLLGFFIGGILTGAVRSLMNRKLEELEQRATTAEEENKRLRSDNETLDETRYQLQQRLALFGAETCALDQQLRALFAPSADPVVPGCLKLLRSAANVSSSCVVELGEAGTDGKIIAALDSQWKAGESLPKDKLAMARAAIEAQSIVTWKAGAPSADTDFLAAVPWKNSAGGKVVVLIEDMPFSAIGQAAFVRIEMIVRWVARFFPEASATADPARSVSAGTLFVTAEEFESQYKLARKTFEQLRLPSTIVEFETGEPELGKPSAIELLQKTLGVQLQAPRVVCTEGNAGKLRVLLPMEGIRDAETFVAALLQTPPPGSIRHQLIEIGAGDSNTDPKTK